MNEEINVQSGTGNVFADLGLENADELLRKAELMRQINVLTEQIGTINLDQIRTNLQIDLFPLQSQNLSELSIAQLSHCFACLSNYVKIENNRKSIEIEI
ncbi:hypothetical protein GlitD10_0169 [Gloeomargarita lithophora Alchichica-D10]|uniref:XRE family transcriptional regulator n=1 Tax=Gloeomargarita lithophora Alchichica-D10 TaxID=1188229 RepID=A0A1J0A971_9CYAN|nr:helix-turn-helix domain-containing protein [Gloeomargarita lithophora]APB32470.1 hypothetical protein GlitD10_0169 [Gloeomargarita lithophora Alchichica-D10]